MAQLEVSTPSLLLEVNAFCFQKDDPSLACGFLLCDGLLWNSRKFPKLDRKFVVTIVTLRPETIDGEVHSIQLL